MLTTWLNSFICAMVATTPSSPSARMIARLLQAGLIYVRSFFMHALLPTTLFEKQKVSLLLQSPLLL